MTSDKRFLERIARIERGITWEPDGVISSQELRRIAARKSQRKRKGQSLSVLIAAAAALIYLQPDVPEPIKGFFAAPTTEAAIASLNQMPIFAKVSAP